MCKKLIVILRNTHRYKVFCFMTFIKDEAAAEVGASTPVHQLLQACVLTLT